VLNTAELSGTPAGGTLAPVTSDHVVPVAPAPGYAITKATTSTPTAEGQTLDYTFTLENTGNVTIADIVVADAKCATPIVLDSETGSIADILEVGETQVWSCTSIPVTQAEVDAGEIVNTVTAIGTPAGGALAEIGDDLIVPVAAVPSWEMVKATSSVPANAGDTLDYTFTVVNTGNVTIADVVVADAKCDLPATLTAELLVVDGILNPGETQIYGCTSIPVTQAEVDAGIVLNTATVVGVPASGDLLPVEDALETPVGPNPSWVLTKTSPDTPTAAGDILTYNFTLVNNGNVTISDVIVVDPKCDPAPALDSESIQPANGVLDAGETQVWSCSSIPVTQAEADAAIPGWQLTKDSPTQPRQAGDTLEYVFTLTNTGNVTVLDPVVADAKCAAPPALTAGDTDSDGNLGVGETWQLGCTSIPVTDAEVAVAMVVNVATATGTLASGTIPDLQANHVKLLGIPDESLGNVAGQPVTVDLLANDGGGEPLDPASVQFIDPSTGLPTKTLTVPGEGVWTVDDTGMATFTPEPGFVGDPTPVDYQVDVIAGGTLLAEIVITYLDPVIVIPPPVVDERHPIPEITQAPPGPQPRVPMIDFIAEPLAFTGVSSTAAASVGLLLMAVGSTLLGLDRRRRRYED